MPRPLWIRDISQGFAGTTRISLPIESSGINRTFIFGVAYKSNSVVTETSLNFEAAGGNQPFTIERRAVDGGDAQVSLWSLVGPDVETANVVLTMPSSHRMAGFVALFTGVDQANPFVSANTVDAQGIDNNPTVNLTSDPGETAISVLCQVSAGPDTITGQIGTLMMNLSGFGGGTDTRGGAARIAGADPITMDYNMSDTDNWNIIAASLQEPPAADFEHPFHAGNINPAVRAALVR